MTDAVTCPSCGSQYLASATTCADCGVPLVGGEPLPPGDDEVGYDLDDWTDEQRLQLAVTLTADGVPYRWEARELVVREADTDGVDLRIEEIDHPEALEVDQGDDDGGGEVLSALYVAADVLQHDATHTVAVVDLLEAAEQASELGPPYGLERELWIEVLRRADALADLLGAEAPDDDVMAAARSLREAVHPLV